MRRASERFFGAPVREASEKGVGVEIGEKGM